MTDIIKNGVIGALLVFICLVIVFDLRVALWIAVGIPLSFVGSLIFFGAADLTLNIGTVFAFFLLVGIVVDDAVVVGESIAAERETGKSALDATIGGAKAVFGPITIGVITTLLALVPFAFITTGNFQILAVFPVCCRLCIGGIACGSIPDTPGAPFVRTTLEFVPAQGFTGLGASLAGRPS